MQSLDGIFAAFSGDVPGAAVLIRSPDGVVLRAFGLANLESRAYCAPCTNFRLASVSKQFTALSVVVLASRGSLSLDSLAAEYLPGLKSCATIRHLLAHRAGIRDYEELLTSTVAVRDRDVLELVRDEPPLFAPGTQFRYSNTGYALLALIVERVAGQSFAEFLHHNIFAPLGMNNTIAFQSGVSEVPHRALGYTQRGPVFAETDQSLTSSVLGDGGIYSSIADLSLWIDAIADARLVDRSWWRQIFAITSPGTDFPGSGYGFGWYVKPECVWHYGETCGFSTWLEWRPRMNTAIVILANRSGLNLAPVAGQLV